MLSFTVYRLCQCLRSCFDNKKMYLFSFNDMKRNILITGGAGYIGSHCVNAFLNNNDKIIVIDNIVDKTKNGLLKNITFYKENLSDSLKIKEIISYEKPDVVIHLAASVFVNESMLNPLPYWQNNLANSINLLNICVDLNIRNFLFSSTAAVYDSVDNNDVLSENHQCMPLSPYGKSKLLFENIVKDTAQIYKFNYAILRYFNVAGIDEELQFLQNAKTNSQHLIDVACQAAIGIRKFMYLYGNDYNTPDGTCQRDFIHVSDLADIHVNILDYIMNNNKSVICNCGTGIPSSVNHVINTIKKLTGSDFQVISESRRVGDPDSLIASTKYIESIIDLNLKYKDLDSIILSSLRAINKTQGHK